MWQKANHWVASRISEGPKKISFEQMAREVVARQGEAKTVVVDSQVGYFGTPLSMNSLVTA